MPHRELRKKIPMYDENVMLEIIKSQEKIFGYANLLLIYKTFRNRFFYCDLVKLKKTLAKLKEKNLIKEIKDGNYVSI
jgi:uncharacterized protein YlbG (UPF0298 family)